MNTQSTQSSGVLEGNLGTAISILIGIAGVGLSLSYPNARDLGFDLMIAGFGGAALLLIYRFVIPKPPSFADWTDIEARFSGIAGELEGIWSVDATTKRIEWSVMPTSSKTDQYGDGNRRRDRFISEARIAGTTLLRFRRFKRNYQVNSDATPEDHWLCAVGANVHSASGMRISGVDNRTPTPIITESRRIERLVDASRHFCAHLASLAK